LRPSSFDSLAKRKNLLEKFPSKNRFQYLNSFNPFCFQSKVQIKIEASSNSHNHSRWKTKFSKNFRKIEWLEPHANVSTERPFSKFHLIKISHRNRWKFGTIQSLISLKEKVTRRTYDKIGYFCIFVKLRLELKERNVETRSKGLKKFRPWNFDEDFPITEIS